MIEKSKPNLQTLFYFFLFLISGVETSAVEIKNTRVIYDNGGRTTKDYISAINIGGHKSNKDLFPIITKEMSVGRVAEEEGRDIKYAAASRPFFIVGYDAVSIDWLKANSELLIKRNAIGYVANVRNMAEMNYLARLLEDKVMLLPMNVSEIARELNIQHYPFYIDNKGVLR